MAIRQACANHRRITPRLGNSRHKQQENRTTCRVRRLYLEPMGKCKRSWQWHRKKAIATGRTHCGLP